MEIEAIYAKLTMMNYRSLVLTAANSGEGVTSVASALAQRYLLAGRSTLVVDLNLYHPNLNALLPLAQSGDKQMLLDAPQLVSESGSMNPLVGIVAPKDRAAIMKLRNPGILEGYLQHWYKHYDMVIIDASPINRVNGGNIPAERIASACDACIMVVLAGHTRDDMIVEACGRLEHAEVNFIGCILNDRDNPSLKDELIYQAKRMEKRFTRLSLLLQSYIRKNQFLSLDS